MATVLELPTLDRLREEQRALRAVLGAAAPAAAAGALARVRRRMPLIVLAATAAILVFLDWWFRFGVPVRVVLLLLALAGVLVVSGHRAFRRYQASRLDELTLAMTLDRHRPGTGQQIADVLQLPELLDEDGVDRLAGDGATGGPARVCGSGRVGLAHALEPQANGAGNCGGRAGVAATALVLRESLRGRPA